MTTEYDARDVDNLTDYLMRATHVQLVNVTLSLGRELIARALPGDVVVCDVGRGLATCSPSMPRAEPLARPQVPPPAVRGQCGHDDGECQACGSCLGCGGLAP